jgi:phosphatidylserine/phosphatidylglycerophosphate/cardiolipin synthase-like enzyme
VDWLEELIKVLNAAPAPDEHPSSTSAAYFSPGDACLKRIIGLIGNARRRADICVFTITDDRIARALRQAHERGVALRIITDNDKANDLGSDVSSLLRAGIPLRVDRSPHHMHHKFAIFDGSVMVTGSYNWTRSAADFNAENLVVTDDVGLLGEFQDVFDGMWTELGAVS